MAKYKKRKDGRYHTTIGTKHIDANGKEIRIPVYGNSISEFEKNKDKVKAELHLGLYANDRNTLFRDYKEHWHKIYVENTKLSHNRKQSYKGLIKNHTSKLDPFEIGKIKKSDVQESYNDLNGHPATQHEFKITVNQIFKCAIDDGLIVKNPASNIKTTRAKKDKVKNRALTKEERKAITTVDFTLKEKCFVLMLQYTGARRGEIIPLTKNDINLKNDKIVIDKAVEFIGEKPNLKDTKTFKGERAVDVLNPLKSILAQYTKSLDTPLLFPNEKGTIMTKAQYRRFFEVIKIKVNTALGGKHERQGGKIVFTIDMCKNFTAKAFRHEYATILYYSGVDLLEAIRLFGHADTKTLTDIYAELREEESNSRSKLNEYLEQNYS